MNNEDYVSFEQAKKVKEVGFDWKCDTFWGEGGSRENPVWVIKQYHDYPFVDEDCAIFRPTLAQAQKWLREVKELDIDITLFREIDAREEPAKLKRYYNCEIVYSKVEEDLYDDFDSYEKALSAGIDKALELLKKENK